MPSPIPSLGSEPLSTHSRRQASCFPTPSRPAVACAPSVAKLLETLGVRNDFELFAAHTFNLKPNWTAGPLSEYLKFALGVWQMCDCSACVEFGRSCKDRGDAIPNQKPHTPLWGSAFKRCAEELKHFVAWRNNTAELRVDERMAEQNIYKVMFEFNFFEDADGRIQPDDLPKGYSKTWFLQQQRLARRYQQESTTSKPPASAPEPAVKAVSSAAAVQGTTPSSRVKGKSRERCLPTAVLSDCRRFKTCAESNTAERTVMSMGATLVDVMRELNRSVLRSSAKSWLVVEFVEFASLVAQLNYAASIYLQFADDMEILMDALKVGIVEESFRMINSTRSSHIEAEERRSAGQQRSAAERKARRLEIQDQYRNKVPDETEVRDGVQTVLFTFVWITETAFQDADTANAAIANRLIPLLETVIVRCTRQAYLLFRARIAYGSLTRMTGLVPPSAVKFELNLVELSMALQTFAGCDLTLFTAAPKQRSTGRKKEDKTAKRSVEIRESIVAAPYASSIYCMAVADVTLRLLKGMSLEIACGTFRSGPPDCCKDERCPQSESSIARRVEEMSRRLRLIEKTQTDWKPMLVPREQGPKRRKKKKDTVEAAGEPKTFKTTKALFEDQIPFGKTFSTEVEDVLKKRVAAIEKAYQACPTKNGDSADDKTTSKAAESSTPAVASVDIGSPPAPVDQAAKRTKPAATPTKSATIPPTKSAPTSFKEPPQTLAPPPKGSGVSSAGTFRSDAKTYYLDPRRVRRGSLEEMFADAPPAFRSAMRESSLLNDAGKLHQKLRDTRGTTVGRLQAAAFSDAADVLGYLQSADAKYSRAI